jgi:aspartyl/asparaginyl beta-hydroxylase (cupin superfamily)
MDDIRTLRAFAQGRKLITFRYLGEANKKWLADMYELYQITPAKKARTLENHGVQDWRKAAGDEVVDYVKLLKTYEQKYIDNDIELDPILQKFHGIENLRFATLNNGETLEKHLDNPWTKRLIIVIQGTQRTVFETGDDVAMSTGNIYFINGCYRHSVVNTTVKGDRIALLCNFKNNKHNRDIINNELVQLDE